MALGPYPIQTLQQWTADYGLTFPILQDTDYLVWNNYGMGYIPHNTLIDTAAKVLYTDFGYDEAALISLIENYYQAVYAKDVLLSSPSLQIGVDSLEIKAAVSNKGSHNAEIKALISADDVLQDSLSLFDDGLHNDGSAEDGIWGNKTASPAEERTYSVGLKTLDLDYGVSSTFNDMARFTTAGPLRFDGYVITKQFTSFVLMELILRNDGTTGTVENVSAILSTDDSRVNAIGSNMKSFGDIAPGQSAVSSGEYVISLSNLSGLDSIVFNVEISSGGYHFWDDSSTITIVTTDIKENTGSNPALFSLSQNYPNPFNPSTTFEFSIPKTEFVTLKLYDISGKQAAEIISSQFPAGRHTYSWNAESLASGIYYYTIQAGEFKQTKKLILIR